MIMNDLMIDIETLGTAQGCCVLSVAAVEFDRKTGKTGSEFYAKIDVLSCIIEGLTVNKETLKWWKKQNPAALKELTTNTHPLKEVLQNLSDFIKGDKVKSVWANSPSFDCEILKYCFEVVGIETPWKFWQEQCVRTLSSLDNNESKHSIEFDGVAHNALDDCKHQIKYCCAVYSKLF